MSAKSKNIKLIIIIYSAIIFLSLVLLRLGEFSLFYSSQIPLVLVVIAAVAFAIGWYVRRSSTPTVIDYRIVRELKISPREYEVLQYLAEEMTNSSIAKCLYISESAVKKHVSQLLKKVEASNRKDLIQKAMIKGLLIKKA